MKRSRKSNRVSWAPGVNLCQVKLFLRDDCPSKVGGKHQDTLKAKTSPALRFSGMCANYLPSGFRSGHYASGLKYDLAEIPRIQWTSPPKVVLDFNWHVVAGEESKEVEAQKLRELRVLEAVYPHRSSIPPSPSVSLDVEVECYDDIRTPLIPLTPVEDEEGEETSSDSAAQGKTPSNSETAALLMPQGLSNPETQSIPHCPSSIADVPVFDMLPGVSSNIMASASSALTAVMKSKEWTSLIDTDLLVNILSDPEMVEKLIHDIRNQSAAVNPVSSPVYTSEPETRKTSLTLPKPVTSSTPLPAERYSNHISSKSATKADIVSFSKPMKSSIPLSGAGINMISGNKASTLNQLQPARIVLPVNPNSVQKMQPAISSTPMQLNAGIVSTAMETNPRKMDTNYFKNLIREHGREKTEAKGHNISQTGSHFNYNQNLMKLGQNLEHVAMKAKFKKPCLYFNGPKGCRNGLNCSYVHDQLQTGKMFEGPSAKRMKIGREITGSI